jgi:peptide/nickel transport system permease protein
MRFVLTRFGYAVLVVLLASMVTFLGLHGSSGSVVSSVFNLSVTPHYVIIKYERSHGLLDPIWVQYWRYIKGIVTLHFGTSYISELPVMTIFNASVGYTGQLAGAAFLLIFGLGVPIGVVAAINKDSAFDRVVRASASLVLSVPNFVLGTVLILIVGVHLRWLPVGGAGSFKDLIMPAVVLAAEPWAVTVRVTRSSFLEQVSAEFTRTLRARGISERRIMWRHVLRNSLGPVISLGSIQVRNLLGYTLLIEMVFRWPGLGSQLTNAVLNRDYAVAETLSLLLAIVVVLASVLGDVILRLVDPRVRVTGGAP